MSASDILSFSTLFALAALSLGLIMTVVRIVRGPTLPDRVLGLDMLTAIVIGFIAVIAIRSGFNLYIDIAIALALVGFLATIAFARFILTRGRPAEAEGRVERNPKRGGRSARRKGGRPR
ncbi:MAG TPA: cation:proton antiporter [Pararhizobium sp.]|uniref:cation:proton antiporter n=1 Tax=Pararhizobium sp. TaxID=1977563 RepID=UPI002BFFA35C|nr:cation:proton antiporter [Pararhizobium sp.]HTO30865.1 cation:proton antiporter [Pararhizobium sp.]